MKHWIYLVCAVGCAWPGWALPGRLQRVDGKEYRGELQITNGFLSVVPTNGPRIKVGLGELRLAQFEARTDLPGGERDSSQGGTGLLGFYFGNTNLQGQAILRLDESVDFEWGAAPLPGISPDRFSVVWSGNVRAPVAGRYIFSIATDQGGRLYIGDRQIAEVGTLRRRTAEIDSIPLQFEAGKDYPLKFTFYDTVGAAEARLLWRGPGIGKQVVPREHLYASSHLTGHVANVTGGQGLLGTYYRGKDFSGASFTRIDPGIEFKWLEEDPAPGLSRTNFSVRWSGRVVAGHTEEYTFYTMTADRVRLWVDDQLIVNRPKQTWTAETSNNLLLAAGEHYDIRMETQAGRVGGLARLSWSSPSTTKQSIPQSRLFPSKASRSGEAHQDDAGRMPIGLLLRSGAFLACNVESGTRSSIRVSGLAKGIEIPTVAVARIICQPLSSSMAVRLAPGRVGLLLEKGDFVDGEFRGLAQEKMKLSSVLFGSRSYDMKGQVLVAVLGEVTPLAAAFELHLRDRTVLPASDLIFESGRVVLTDAILGRLSIPATEVAQIRRVAKESGR